MPPGVLVFSAIKAINLHRYFWVKIYVTVILGVKICPKTFRPKLSFIESIPDLGRSSGARGASRSPR
jgi:hypothetical protein